MFFAGWESLLRTLVVGALAYVTLIAFLRVSGKRTLSKMNAFDLIVTVALGSTLATVLLSKDVALAEGAMAFALLIGLQFAVTWSSVRARWVRQAVTGEPLMLVYRGEMLPAALRRGRDGAAGRPLPPRHPASPADAGRNALHARRPARPPASSTGPAGAADIRSVTRPGVGSGPQGSTPTAIPASPRYCWPRSHWRRIAAA